jgi:hypothetical protein
MKWLLLLLILTMPMSTVTREIRTPQEAVDVGLPFDGRIPRRITTKATP